MNNKDEERLATILDNHNKAFILLFKTFTALDKRIKELEIQVFKGDKND